MNILFVYPKYTETFWSFKHALKFISKKASFPPLGLLTVASMLPKKWKKKLIDLNTEELKDEDILWADYVFLSAMSIQKKSADNVINRCKNLNIKVVAGGPHFTSLFDKYEDVDHLILNEAETTLQSFLKDIKNGKPKHLYNEKEWKSLDKTPIPLWELINMKKYSSMCIQYSRGCPFNCEFCNITTLFGRKMRTKTKEQMLNELNALYKLRWKGGVFVVDDNFIINKQELKEKVLPAMIKWQRERRYPFSFITQASINLSDDEELMKLMAKAGFNTVFVGIETPNEESLEECGKYHNKNRNLISCIKKMQKFGLEVQGGFILGFDSDPPTIFKNLASFIQKSGVVTAMVGLLNAPRGTRLYKRLIEERRITKDSTGDNTDFSINFKPKMEYQKLVEGYRKVLENIYSPKEYCDRVITHFKNLQPFRKEKEKIKLHFYHIKALIKSVWILGIKERGRIYYWKLLTWVLLHKPKSFPSAVTFAIYGFHFRKVFDIKQHKYNHDLML